VHRGRGEPDLAGELGVAGPAVGAQQVDQLAVDGVDERISVRVARAGGSRVAVEYSRGRTLAADEGVRAVVTLVAMVVVVAAVVVLVRATASGPGGLGPRRRAPRPARRPRTAQRAVAPDDDPEFLRELDRRARGDN
jgi:hypothetical protein